MQFILLTFLTRKNLLFAFYDVNLLDNYVNTTPNIHDKLLFFYYRNVLFVYCMYLYKLSDDFRILPIQNCLKLSCVPACDSDYETVEHPPLGIP